MSDDQTIGVIYVEDDDDVRIGGVQALELAGFSVSAFLSVETAATSVRSDMPFVVVCDVRLRGKSGLDWLSDLRRLDQDLPVILITGHGDISMAVQAMRNGAYDFIEKPCSSEQLISVVRRAVEKRRLTLEVRSLRSALADRQGIEANLLGRSPQIQEVRRLVSTLASTNVDVTIYGETGTGKDVVARCLHNHSVRRGGNYVPVNCGGLPESLVESELFGHEVGAFTRRNREHAAERAGEVAQVAARSVDRARRNEQVNRGGLPRCGREQDQFVRIERKKAVPRGSVLSAWRRIHRVAAASRATRRHSPAVRALHAGRRKTLRARCADTA
jgi:two-component system, NtrC family, C4-dicarboxylate transport response regulator DctD